MWLGCEMTWTAGLELDERFRPFQHLSSVIYRITKRKVTSTIELAPSVSISYNFFQHMWSVYFTLRQSAQDVMKQELKRNHHVLIC